MYKLFKCEIHPNEPDISDMTQFEQTDQYQFLMHEFESRLEAHNIQMYELW